ncbi:calcium-independent phospholipase A2-gamma-like [Diaphorina citri]|uniref:Calcium-independent phospholipase A2-gamma-like n=1 Tax=Diaphorina citri TaxID=121845 RepID=A0A1S3DW25_DIACI|nr:calcium-independent phospholipase A2-gamma-like [Diaphorina citri]XP_017305261.1 calcium-independent phospholipase A2-gamma-like [Diaphorina citri]
MTLSTDLFTQNKLSGYTSMLLRHAYYDTDKFETFLREYIGETPMIQTNRQRKCPKLSVVSTVVNHDKVWPYVFRNYCIPYERKSQYMGDHKYAMWQAVRASSAAPSIFDEFHLDGLVHQDGGMTVNNPAAVAIHEATLLWPGAPLQCIVSCGTGRTLPKLNATPYSHDTQSASDSAQTAGSSLWHKMVKILESATDTEGVHTCLSDLLPQGVYYRFNPYLSEVPDLDETRPEKLAQLRLDTDIYIRKNEAKFQAATQCLLREKSLVAKMSDYVTRRAYVWNAHL